MMKNYSKIVNESAWRKTIVKSPTNQYGEIYSKILNESVWGGDYIKINNESAWSQTIPKSLINHQGGKLQ